MSQVGLGFEDSLTLRLNTSHEHAVSIHTIVVNTEWLNTQSTFKSTLADEQMIAGHALFTQQQVFVRGKYHG